MSCGCPPHKPSKKIVTGGVQPTCTSMTPAMSFPVIDTGATVKIPVVVCETTVQIDMNSTITLPEPVLEIKDIKKRVKVTQCLLLQAPGQTSGPLMLSLKGFVRQNIDYSNRLCSNAEGVCGDIRHCTVDVPFECTTSVNCNGTYPLPPMPNSSQEFEFFRKEKLRGPGFSEKDMLLSGDLSEFNQVSEEFFNELPYCELISARIVQYDEYLNRRRPKGAKLPFEEREFRQIEEKMVLHITLKILQKRQVQVPSTFSFG